MLRGQSANCLVAVLLLAPLVSGCSSLFGGESQEGHMAPLAATEARPGVREEVAAVKAQTALPGRAADMLAARCMARKGFVFTPLAPQAYEPKPIPHHFGLTVDEARATGYLNVIEPDSKPPREPTEAMSADEAEAYSAALLGTLDDPQFTMTDVFGNGVGGPKAGCLFEARTVVYGSFEDFVRYENFAGNFVSFALLEAEQDPELRDLNERWARCMADRGYDGFTSPSNALAKVVESTPQRSALGRGPARDQAVADAGCQADTSYEARRSAIEDRYLTAVLDRFEAEVTATQEMYRQASARARTVLQQG